MIMLADFPPAFFLIYETIWFQTVWQKAPSYIKTLNNLWLINKQTTPLCWLQKQLAGYLFPVD